VAVLNRIALLEHDPFRLNRIMLSILSFGRIFYGEPVPTSPENALASPVQVARQPVLTPPRDQGDPP
jgi:hypothetical protein